MEAQTTKVQAIAKLIKDNGGEASWPQIEEKIEAYCPAAKASQFWKEGLRGVVYREIRYGRTFQMVRKGVVGLVTGA